MVTHTAIGRSLAVDAGIYHGAAFVIDEYDIAENIITAKDSLWYVQAQKWITKPPCEVPETFTAACQFIVDVVNLGYADNVWWDLSKMDAGKVAMGRLLTLDLLQMIRQIRHNSLIVISRGFELFAQIVCDKAWRDKVRKVARATQPYMANKCIKPECNNLVAPVGMKPQEGHFRNYRGTGACAKEHANYLCAKCNAPHSYASGVGKKHYTP
jgi:hypothetical protein